jgi:excisionase family DNA binding protein
MSEHEYYYSIREVAEILRLSIPSVHRLINAGKLGANKVSERRTRVSEKDLNEFLRRTRVGHPAQDGPKLEIPCDCR